MYKDIKTQPKPPNHTHARPQFSYVYECPMHDYLKYILFYLRRRHEAVSGYNSIIFLQTNTVKFTKCCKFYYKLQVNSKFTT